MRIFFIVWGVFFSLISWSVSEDFEREQRIKPIGEVRLQEGGTLTSKEIINTKTAPVLEKKNSGQMIYEQYCIVCHRDGIAGAPKFQDASDWRSRLSKQNLESLTASAIKGLNAMPSKGTCQECREEDIRAAIEYMVPKS